MMRKIMIRIFLNDLLVNSACGIDKNYVENKRKEWIFLKEVFKTQSVTPISDRPFLYFYDCKGKQFFDLHHTFWKF